MKPFTWPWRRKPTPAAPPVPASVVFWTLAAFLLAALPHLLAMPSALAVIILILLAWRALGAQLGWAPLPGLLRVFLTLALLALVVFSYGAVWGRRLAVGLLCAMLAAKTLEMYRVRDLRMVASVSFFLIASQFLFNERLVYLAYLVAGCWLATQALTQIQTVVTNNPRQSETRKLSGTGQAVLTGLGHSGRLLLMAAPVAVVLFLLFPRLAQPLWGLPEAAMDGRTGLSDSMSPGTISELFIDLSPAFRVEFDGPPPPPQNRYWRGPVLWRFDGNTWHRALFSDQPLPDPTPVTASSLRYRMQLEPHERRWLLALDFPVSASMAESSVTVDHQLVSRHPITTLSQYDVISTPDARIGLELPDLHRRLALQLPADRNPRTQELAQQLRQRYADDRQLIDSVLRWFNEDDFYYSLSVTPLGRHGTDEFLFDLRRGYCEYYASAFAILMRAAGIPTRVVTGYQGGFWNEPGQYLLVRQSDAHAWNEVWLENEGWVRVDPTAAVAPNRIDQGSRSVIQSGRLIQDANWLMALRNQYDRVQHLWNRWVLGFDANRQQQFLQRLGLPELSATGIGLLMIAVIALLLLPLTWLLFRTPNGAGSSRAEIAWQKVLKRMRRLGLPKQPAETPEEFATRVSGQLAQGSSELPRLSRLFSRLHYGQPSETPLKQFEEAAARFQPRRHSRQRHWKSAQHASRH